MGHFVQMLLPIKTNIKDKLAYIFRSARQNRKGSAVKPSEQFVCAVGSWMDFFLRRSLHEFFVYSRRHGLSIAQMLALSMIRRKGTSNVSDIGAELEITNPAASQLLERLVQQGLVARTEDPNDRRLKQIALTRHGEAALRQGMPSRRRWLDALAEMMPPEEQQQVIAALQLLLQRAHQLEFQNSLEV